VLTDIHPQRSATSAQPLVQCAIPGPKNVPALLPILPPAAGTRVPSNGFGSDMDARGVASFLATELPIAQRQQGAAAGDPPRGTG
jgi:hypothetical protein